MMKRCLLLGGLFLGACQQGADSAQRSGAPSVDAPVSVGAMIGSGQQALSMGNGPGMGMNGPGMGMNGPGMGMNGITVGYTTSADKLAKVGLAYVSPVGATRTSTGTPLATVNLVKGELRGVINGSPKTYLSGTGFSGGRCQPPGGKPPGASRHAANARYGFELGSGQRNSMRLAFGFEPVIGIRIQAERLRAE